VEKYRRKLSEFRSEPFCGLETCSTQNSAAQNFNNSARCQSNHRCLSSVKLHFLRNSVPFCSVPSFGIGSSAELGMPRNEHFLPRYNGNHSESIPRNFFGTKFRSQPYTGLYYSPGLSCPNITSARGGHIVPGLSPKIQV
jgi:hypothetical protein